MKIAFINKYQNKVFRGAETFVYELGKRLAENHKVDILTSAWPLIHKKYDIVIPTNGRFQVLFVRVVTWLSGSKMIVSGQSGMGWDDRVNLYSFPNVFIALSTSALSWAKKVNPLVKSVYIPNGVDIDRFKPGRSPKKTKVVLAVGAFTRQKRLDLTIKAVSKLENVKLLIAGGGGELRGELEGHAKKLLKGRFEIVSVPYSQMPEIYRSADIFTLPSAPSESFGNVLVEAMASGLPVVATDDPIRRGVVGDAGLFVDPTNIEEYSKTLNLALEKKWGKAPILQAKKFDWDLIADKYEKILASY